MDGHSSTSNPALCTALVAGLASVAWASPPPLFADFHYLMPEGWRDSGRSSGTDPCETVPQLNYTGENMYMPVNQPGGQHGGPQYGDDLWMSWFAKCFAENLDETGAPIGLMIRNRNCPTPYADEGYQSSPDALADALDALPKLDYLILDLEPFGHHTGFRIVEENVKQVINLVRSHPNPRVSNAYIGNYGDTPVAWDQAKIHPRRRDMTRFTTGEHEPFDRHGFYHDYLNIAMPIAYPLEIFSRHSDEGLQRGDTTPNDRAAAFWAPLERISSSARELPQGHILIPWLSNFVASATNADSHHAPPPSFEDIEALKQHARLRGANSFVIWTSSTGNTHHPDIDYGLYREIALGAWSMLDPIFSMTETVEFVNLETEKGSPIQWSGVRAGDTIQFLVSNLDETDTISFNLPLIGGVPAKTPPIEPGEHVLLTYDINPAVRDFNGDRTVNNQDFYGYIMSFIQDRTQHPNAVGGAGGDWRDINSDGYLDLQDLLAVAQARARGEFTAFADDRRNTGGEGALK